MTSNATGKNRLAFSTRTIHGGQSHDPTTGAVMVPIYATSTYGQQSPGVHKGFEYARSQNPTRFAFERAVADLESGTRAFAFASGLASISTVLELLDAGAHIVATDDIYGGTFRLLERVRKRSAGLQVSFADFTDLTAIEAAIRPETKLLWVETPTNPLLRIVDLEAVAALAKRKGLLTVADNTFCSPYIQRPLELGIDIVVHSTTKYLNGHSDMVGGVAVVGDNQDLADRLKFLQNAIGAISGPFDSFLALRGIKTLALRMERHSANGLKIAEWLESRNDVRRVIYPGLASHPQHEIAKRQMHAFGGMISVELDRDLAGTKRFLERTQLFTLAESLGGVESLIEHPALMTHGSIPAEKRGAIGISDSLVRLSAGIEDGDDLIADLEQALRG
ncbi:cystathionine gamma-synthase [Mesorhizobium sp. M4B.F.Ca.ET.215.01.1.1]|uniref:cystathionine gamma-synthase n=1 Tax=unclassified Mesorhizobium TaxID=325217 RepID=UPI000FCA71F0|nr:MULTISPECIES: cystathionine gamma-synthase [unclassified Mesorhizobium]RUW22805.1 cystathionine gamma-synthase [Mesorhizobium sp. M4B.F.Ca.ET.013.02.1.1]RVD46164.1 cystathionine gamma-synthase [Mesorhizobium sp. M4B.F.Ca.ET.019.03.1.1]RWX69567.1 cystathionine gamma-synthase [Mesorhizobium sp. M4B.F.Ca.ET.089.01.1.1]TGQ04714.1 cystathionine gamma-synthase [Mesorhizobium sp. M4B.F.Ca.ET.215.01.1.1]TGQ27780.1 cystathionine gamma-synthase [Mesorhizobium sp. M00.F.Ca.ET.220.01.1.1]